MTHRPVRSEAGPARGGKARDPAAPDELVVLCGSSRKRHPLVVLRHRMEWAPLGTPVVDEWVARLDLPVPAGEVAIPLRVGTLALAQRVPEAAERWRRALTVDRIVDASPAATARQQRAADPPDDQARWYLSNPRVDGHSPAEGDARDPGSLRLILDFPPLARRVTAQCSCRTASIDVRWLYQQLRPGRHEVQLSRRRNGRVRRAEPAGGEEVPALWRVEGDA